MAGYFDVEFTKFMDRMFANCNPRPSDMQEQLLRDAFMSGAMAAHLNTNIASPASVIANGVELIAYCSKVVKECNKQMAQMN